MNELIKIEGREIMNFDGVSSCAVIGIDGEEWLKTNKHGAKMWAMGIAAVRLNEVAELAYSDPQAALDLLESLKNAGVNHFGELDYLIDAVYTHLFWSKTTKQRRRESSIQDHFFKNISLYLSDATVTKVLVDKNHIPDGFLKFGDKLATVEVKRDKFTSSSLKQLRRYMKVYNAPIGVAVAPTVSCKLPSDIIYVRVSHEDI